MARYRLSNAADQKIFAIYEYSLLQFGERQADRYFVGLHELFETLAENSNLGGDCSELGDGLRRFAYQSHMVFYRPIAEGVLVVDIFGERQIPRFLLPE